MLGEPYTLTLNIPSCWQVLALCCPGNSSCPVLRAALASGDEASSLCNMPPSQCDAQARLDREGF